MYSVDGQHQDTQSMAVPADVIPVPMIVEQNEDLGVVAHLANEGVPMQVLVERM